MKEITLKAYAKVNLAIDVLGKRPDGYHRVHMVMQQIDLYDEVRVSWKPAVNKAEDRAGTEADINLSCNMDFLPTDHRNLAYKAARLMADRFMDEGGLIDIHIEKHIPVAAGLAGGSSNGAAVLHALNKLWGLNLSLSALMEMGTTLGADIPFCLAGQAALNPVLGLEEDPNAGSCAVAAGIGEELTKIQGLKAWVLLSKPPISVSTAEVYQGLDLPNIGQRPNIPELVAGIKENNYFKITKNMVNVLETYSLKEYSIVVYTKNKIIEEGRPIKALMSGSGPTVFGVFTNRTRAKKAYQRLAGLNKESFLVKLL